MLDVLSMSILITNIYFRKLQEHWLNYTRLQFQLETLFRTWMLVVSYPFPYAENIKIRILLGP